VLQEPEQVVPEQSRLTAGNSKVFGYRIHERDQLVVSFREDVNVILVLRRLRAHEAITAAALRDE
jgi:hypothetical protein